PSTQCDGSSPSTQCDGSSPSTQCDGSSSSMLHMSGAGPAETNGDSRCSRYDATGDRMTRHIKGLRRSAKGRLFVPMLATLFVSLSLSRGARGAAFDVGDTGWEGCSEMLDIVRSELGAARVQPVGVLNWEELTSDDGVLALHPLQAMDADEST